MALYTFRTYKGSVVLMHAAGHIPSRLTRRFTPWRWRCWSKGIAKTALSHSITFPDGMVCFWK